MAESVSERLRHGGERPAQIVKTVALMLLGAGLALALILKVYMFVLTDHVCEAGSQTLGNAIRCEPTLSMLSVFLAVAAGLELAYLIFVQRFQQIFGPLVLAICSAFLFVLSGMGDSEARWQTALIIAALMAAISAIVLLRLLLDRAAGSGESRSRDNGRSEF